MEPLLEWPINSMKPLLTRQRKDWQTYSKVWIDVKISTAQLYQLVFFSVFKLFLVYLLGIVYFIQNYMYVNFVLSLNVFLLDRAVQLGQDLQKIPFKDRSWLGYKTRSSKFKIKWVDIIYRVIFSSNFVLVVLYSSIVHLHHFDIFS